MYSSLQASDKLDILAEETRSRWTTIEQVHGRTGFGKP